MVATSMVPTVKHVMVVWGALCVTLWGIYSKLTQRGNHSTNMPSHPVSLELDQHLLCNRTMTPNLPPLIDYLRWLLPEAQGENAKGVQSVYWSKGWLFWRILTKKQVLGYWTLFVGMSRNQNYWLNQNWKKLRPKSQDSKRNYSANSVFSTGLESFCGGRLQRRVGGHIQPKMFAWWLTRLTARVNMYADIGLPATLILSYINIEKGMTQ